MKNKNLISKVLAIILTLNLLSVGMSFTSSANGLEEIRYDGTLIDDVSGTKYSYVVELKDTSKIPVVTTNLPSAEITQATKIPGTARIDIDSNTYRVYFVEEFKKVINKVKLPDSQIDAYLDPGPICALEDGSYIAISNSSSYSNDVQEVTCKVEKFDSSGNAIWTTEKSFSGWAYTVAEHGGYYYIGGYKSKEIDTQNVNVDWILKIDSSGNLLKEYTGTQASCIHDFVFSTDGSKVFGAGYVNSDSHYTSSDGGEVTLAEKRLELIEKANKEQLTENEVGILLRGEAQELDGQLAANEGFIKSFLVSDLSIDTSFGSEGAYVKSGVNKINSVAKIGDKLYATGEITNTTQDLAVISVDETGTTNSSFGDQGLFTRTSSGSEYGIAIESGSDGGLLVLASANKKDGDVDENLGGTDVWLVKIKEDGTMDTQFHEDGYLVAGSKFSDTANDLVALKDGYAVLYTASNYNTSSDWDFGHRGSGDVGIKRFDEKGREIWQRYFGGSQGEYAKKIVAGSDKQLAFMASSYSTDGDLKEPLTGKEYQHGTMTWFVKLDAEKPWVRGYKFKEPKYTVEHGETRETVFEAVYSDDSTVNLSSDVTYDFDPTKVAIVNSTGLVKGENIGTTVLKAVYGEFNNTTEIEVIKSSNSYLKDLKVNGVSLTGFDKDTLNYRYNTGTTDKVAPKITYTLDSDYASAEVIQNDVPPGRSVVKVTAEDGTYKEYKIDVERKNNTDATLKWIKIDGVEVEDFSPTNLAYYKKVPEGTKSVNITAEPNDSNAEVTIINGGVPGVTKVEVLAEDRSIKQTYTVDVTINQKSSNANLSDIKVNRVSLADFSSSKLTYEKEMPLGTKKATIEVVKEDEKSVVEEVYKEVQIPSTTKFEVIAENGVTKKIYSVTLVEEGKSQNANLKDLKLNGSTVPDFSSSKLNYDVKLDKSETSISIFALPENPKSVVDAVYLQEIPGRATITVTAEDIRYKKTYTIDYSYKSVTVTDDEGSTVATGNTTTVVDDSNAREKQLNEIVNDPNKTETQKIEDTKQVIEDMQKLAENVKYMGEAIVVANSVEDMIDDMNKLLLKIGDDKKQKEVLKNMDALYQTARFALKNITAENLVIDKTDNILKKSAETINSVEGDKANQREVKRDLIRFTEDVLNQSGEVDIDENKIVETEEEFRIVIDKPTLDSHITEPKAVLNHFKETLKGALTDAEIEEIDYTLTIKIPHKNKQKKLVVDVRKEVLDAMKDYNLKTINLKLGRVTYSLEKDTFELKDNFESVVVQVGEPGEVSEELGLGVEKLDKTPLLQLEVKRDENEVESFKRPIKISVDISDFDLSKMTEEEKKNINIYIQDEITKEWKPVGGKYDPVTKKITVYRIHLSNYTVAKSTKKFTDVEDHWAKKELNNMLGKGILDDEKKFNPEEKVTREEFAGWVSRAYGLELDDISTSFEDLDKSNPYYKEILAAYSQGIINGKSEKKFDPKGNITREEMATLADRAVETYNDILSADAQDPLDKYSDIDQISAWAKDGVSNSSDLGLFDEFAEDEFKPKEDMTKAEAASVVSYLYDNF